MNIFDNTLLISIQTLLYELLHLEALQDSSKDSREAQGSLIFQRYPRPHQRPPERLGQFDYFQRHLKQPRVSKLLWESWNYLGCFRTKGHFPDAVSLPCILQSTSYASRCPTSCQSTSCTSCALASFLMALGQFVPDAPIFVLNTNQ